MRDLGYIGVDEFARFELGASRCACATVAFRLIDADAVAAELTVEALVCNIVMDARLIALRRLFIDVIRARVGARNTGEKHENERLFHDGLR